MPINIDVNFNGNFDLNAFRNTLNELKNSGSVNELNKLLDQLQKNLADVNKVSDAKKVKDYNTALADTAFALQEVSKNSKQANTAFDEFNSTIKESDQDVNEFIGTVGDLAAGKSMSELKTTLKQLQNEFAKVNMETDPELANRYAVAIGGIRDRMTSLNEQANTFAAGSQFEIFGNQVSLAKDQLMNLDFEGVTETLNTMNMALKNGSLNFAGFGKAFQSLGAVFKTVGTQLLTNPIFLIQFP